MILFFSYFSIYRKLHAQFEMSSRLQSRINSESAQMRALERSHTHGLSYPLHSFLPSNPTPCLKLQMLNNSLVSTDLQHVSICLEITTKFN